jgi:serine/threonine-protein kinase
MAADLDSIVEELGLPEFQVPAPRNSAQHRALEHSRMTARPSAAPNPTRQFTRGPGEAAAPRAEPDVFDEMDDDEMDDDEFASDSGEFAGIPIDEFVWARQHRRRMLLIWVAVVLTLAGLVATAGWTVGVHLSTLL